MASMTSRQQSEFTAAVVRHLPCDRIPVDVAQRYIGNPAELATLLERVFVPEQAVPAVLRPAIVRKIKLRIDRSVAPADMILATRCDYIYEWMLTHCPAWKGAAQEEVEVCLIDMGRDWLRDEAFSAIDELGLQRAPDNAPLWTLSKTHPDLQRETWVVDPETVWRDEYGRPCVACVCGHPGERSAGLGHVGHRWLRRNLVLALSK